MVRPVGGQASRGEHAGGGVRLSRPPAGEEAIAPRPSDINSLMMIPFLLR